MMNMGGDTLYCIKKPKIGYLPYTMSYDEGYTIREFCEEEEIAWDEARKEGTVCVMVRVTEI
jgi:hypothetical protein